MNRTTIGLAVLLVLLTTAAVAHPQRLVVLAVAVALGLALASYGLRRTAFDVTPHGLYYTPNAHIGIALSLLFTARIVYRFVELGSLDLSSFVAGEPHAGDFARSPLTLAVFGLLAGYYVGYAIGLLRWRARVGAARAAAPPADANRDPSS